MEKGILSFRIETSCFYKDRFYTATDEPGDHPAFAQFPASLLYEVPEHFTPVDEGGNVDEELDGKRKEFFKWARPILVQSTPDNQAEILEKLRVGRENFLASGTPDGVVVKQGAAPTTDDGLDALSKTELMGRLDDLKVSYTQAESKAVLIGKIREALAQGA